MKRSSSTLKRQVQLFLTPQDEDALLTAVRSAVRAVELVDGQRWTTADPPVKTSVSSCQSSDVYLWNRSIVPQLPYVRRPGGGFQGPTSGVVIQWLRCRTSDSTLLSGRLAIGTSDPQVMRFADLVWKVLRGFAKTDLVTLAGDPAPEFRVGPDARQWLGSSPANRLRERSTETYFVPLGISRKSCA